MIWLHHLSFRWYSYVLHSFKWMGSTLVENWCKMILNYVITIYQRSVKTLKAWGIICLYLYISFDFSADKSFQNNKIRIKCISCIQLYVNIFVNLQSIISKKLSNCKNMFDNNRIKKAFLCKKKQAVSS